MFSLSRFLRGKNRDSEIFITGNLPKASLTDTACPPLHLGLVYFAPLGLIWNGIEVGLDKAHTTK